MAKNILDTIFVENVKFQKESAIRSVLPIKALRRVLAGFQLWRPPRVRANFCAGSNGAQKRKNLFLETRVIMCARIHSPAMMWCANHEAFRSRPAPD
ncbi:hypothetical protein Mmc1_1135 [Magnetococcus marinus MC-1]|uniref:Uncharacterized protein n=1 Tax=Magnetococcus marinus (strain ATCC BAA-1437 / JCM 17883 / MC-1) TaxID=156889 RepID=A0L6Q6_MAGMM|nr:hypothetical protein Mmc1_1135 [Magnetococcus marinus MC-1]